MEQLTQESHKKAFSWPLFLTPFVARMGDAMYIFGLNWFIIKATGQADLLGTVQAIGGIVLVIGDIFAGPLVDNFNRKKIMLGSDFISLVACLILALVVDVNHPQFYQLVLLTSILDIGWAFNFPAAKALIPQVITREGLSRFNAFSNTSFNMADILAPLIGGVLLTFKFIDFRSFLLINAISFFISFSIGLLIPYKYEKNPNRPKINVWKSVKEGFQYMYKRPKLLRIIAADSVLNIVVAGVLIIFPYVVKHYYGGHEQLYSYLMSVEALGGLVGGLSIAFLDREITYKKASIDMVIAGLILIAAGFVQEYAFVLLVAVLYGFFLSRIGVRLMTLVQNNTSVDYLGRIFAVWFLSVDSMHPVGNFMFGFIIDAIGNRAFMVMGGLLAGGVIIVNLLFRGYLTKRETE